MVFNQDNFSSHLQIPSENKKNLISYKIEPTLKDHWSGWSIKLLYLSYFLGTKHMENCFVRLPQIVLAYLIKMLLFVWGAFVSYSSFLGTHNTYVFMFLFPVGILVSYHWLTLRWCHQNYLLQCSSFDNK